MALKSIPCTETVWLLSIENPRPGPWTTSRVWKCRWLFKFIFVSFKFCEEGWLCKGGNAQEGYCKEGSPRPFATLSPSASFVMASVLFLGKPLPWRASWVDFCRTWMIIGVLDSYSPGQSPEPALLFLFDLPFKFPEEAGWTEDQRFLHLLLFFLYDSLSARSLAQLQINSSADQLLRISPILVERAVQMDPRFQRRGFLLQFECTCK